MWGSPPNDGAGGLGHSCVHALHRVLVTALESQVSVSRNQDGAGSGEWQGLCLGDHHGALNGSRWPVATSRWMEVVGRRQMAPRCQE